MPQRRNRVGRTPKQVASYRANQARREAAMNNAQQRRDWKASDDATALAYLTELRTGPGHADELEPVTHYPMGVLPATFLNMYRVFCAVCGKRLKELETTRLL